MKEGDYTGRKILIVEDDFSSRLYLNKLVERSGIGILNATTGSEALELASSDSSIDIILMDIQLPVIDGIACTRMLREAGNKSIIIAQTAYGLTGDKEAFLSSGFNDYLIKPISKLQLLEKMGKYLDIKK
jgi:CheY-like chemotaxis protein